MTNARNGYLENEVLSASPAKLHLLLVEGAMRSGEQVRQHWRDGRNDLAFEALIRAQEIVTEMMGGLNREASPQLTDRIAGIYLFVFRSLVQAGVEHSETRIEDALRVLSVERDTWRLVCEKLKQEADDGGSPPEGTPLPPHFGGLADAGYSGFSLEA